VDDVTGKNEIISIRSCGGRDFRDSSSHERVIVSFIVFDDAKLCLV